MDKKTKKEPGIKEWAIILAAGALLLLLSVPDLFRSREKETQASKTVVQQTVTQQKGYAEQMEEKLEKMLLKVKGVTSADVVITVKSTTEKVVLQDTAADTESLQEEDGGGGLRSSQKVTEEKKTVLSGNEPYLTKELTPEVAGVVVVISGAEAESVLAISEAVQALFNIPAHKVKIINN
ncbi:MAG: stage III sporulation protein AG [Lachnospiraceae bacterium]|nr:stage III sporulation protein AG [Lachnospiraceae bacterium]